MDKKLAKRIQNAISEINEVYKKYGLSATLTIRLPKHENKLPLFARLALWVLVKYGAIIDTLYTDLRKK